VIFALLAAMMLAIAPQTAPPGTSAATAVIRGSVVAADTRMPIRGVRVVLSRVPMVDAGGLPVLGVNGIREAITGRNGAFEFGRLQAGRYEIQPMPLDESAPFIAPSAGRIVELAPGQVVERVEVPLTRGGVIAGRVTDADGTPLTRVSVCALAIASSSAGRVRQYPAASPTDDLGQFRIFGLPDGQFLVSAEAGMSNYAAPGSSLPAETLVPTFYPSTTSEEDSRAVRVRSGADGGDEGALDRRRLPGPGPDDRRGRRRPHRGLPDRAHAHRGPGAAAQADPRRPAELRNVPRYPLIHVMARTSPAMT